MKCFKEQNLTGSFLFFMCFGHNYYNLSNEILSGGRNFNFEAISDLVVDMNFQLKKLTLSI